MFRGTLPLPEQPHVLDFHDVTAEVAGKRVLGEARAANAGEGVGRPDHGGLFS